MKLGKISFCHKHIRRFASTKANIYRSVVGLEVHAQILSESKLFSAASARYATALANSCVAELDAATPGTLPVLNKKCVEAAIRTGLALNCDIASATMFDRKHYFYADMPAGYQITQQRHPIAKQGYISFPLTAQNKMKILKSKIIQIQLEQDSGKSLHNEIANQSLVDLNRAGMPLLEFVFAPDVNTGNEAAALVKELCLILQKLGVSSCKMEEGALRVDANVSIHKDGEPLGVRTEVKNIGSIRGVAHAVDYEILRQTELVKNGKKVVNETRNWDAVSKKTIKMRDKEVVLDYRFMPEPNLIPLHIAENVVSTMKNSLPEMPHQTRQRLENMYKLSNVAVLNLVEDPKLLELFEFIVATNKNRPPQLVANVLLNNLREIYNKHKISHENSPFDDEKIASLIDKLVDETININFVERILDAAMKNSNSDIPSIIEENNWKQIMDDEKITQICQQVLQENPKLVKQYREGKEKFFFALMGIISKMEDGRINLNKASKVLRTILTQK